MTKTVVTDSAKKVYVAPTLTVHGSLTEITQGPAQNGVFDLAGFTPTS